jgi:hydroxymethylbilane synthase
MRRMWTLATRGSKLALWQAQFVKQALLQADESLHIEIKVIQTAGDKMRSSRLLDIGGKGVFTKEIEDTLLAEQADLAVHSLKDLPTDFCEGLMLGAVPVREDARDVLVAKDHVLFQNLPSGAKIGTSSFRRKSQLLKMRPDLSVEETRGNVTTRIRKALEGPLDAVVIARAGVLRLGLEEWITQDFNFDEMLPAPGQGALAVEIRSRDEEAKELLKLIHHEDAFQAVSAERSFLHALGGGCRLPIAAYAEVDSENIMLDGLVASPDGKVVLRDKMEGAKEKHVWLGEALAKKILDAGGGDLLKEAVHGR